MNNFKTYVVKSQKLAGYLMLNGFKLHEIKESISNDGRNVFIFTNSEDLLKKVEQYKLTKNI